MNSMKVEYIKFTFPKRIRKKKLLTHKCIINIIHVLKYTIKLIHFKNMKHMYANLLRNIY